MRKISFEPSQYYHVYNRGVDKRIIFRSERDKFRFSNSLYLLNNFFEIPYRFDVVNLKPKDDLVPIKPLVKFGAICIMPNHFHLLVSPNKKESLSYFLHKVGTSYTKYFNIKYNRTGRLFESTFKAKHVKTNEYISYLTQYIHMNPVDLFQAKLGTLGTKNIIEQVKNYPWSTLSDYVGIKSNLSLLLDSDFINNILDINPKDYSMLVSDIFKTLFQA